MKIKVIHPFSLRLASGVPTREFPIGEHVISDEERKHWFMKACLKEGRATVVVDAPAEEDEIELVSPTASQLKALNRDKLDELAAACGITVPEGANKDDVVALLLAGQEGVTLVKGSDGIYVQKAE